MQTVLRVVIKYLKLFIVFLEQKISVKRDANTDTLNSLAPKIIRDPKELEKIQPYLDSLRKAIQTKEINNIALTGSYGSGKSTIIKTFQYHYPQFQYLNISLASFKDSKKQVSGAGDTPETDSEFERKIEVSILQQIFYHVKPSIIPDSRFKRIINLTTTTLMLQTSFLLLWCLSCIILFKFDYIAKLNPTGWSSRLAFDWLAMLLISIFFAGIGLFVKSVVKLFSNSKINKLNIKGEIELGDDVEKSVFNQHLEEIIYFFERTSFNVVVIEDVDRFESTDIFTKLREINILINNSDLIEQDVKFIYAIKDEMFLDKSERVKFFEFIIPVIPFINPSNAGEQLSRLIRDAKLSGVLSHEFTQDVVTFIDDIDMRLLINIFQEYQLYRENLSKDLEQDNLFAIIVYKNMFPDDFGDLPKRKGKLYDFLSNKKKYIERIIRDIEVNINQIDKRIEDIENESDKSVIELRAVYVSRLISKLDGFYCFYLNGDVNIANVLDDRNFNALRKASPLTYKKYQLSPYQANNYILSNILNSNLTFSSVENEVSSKQSYEQREQSLLDKTDKRVEILKSEKLLLRGRIPKIESLSIKEIFEQVSIEEYLNSFKEDYLIRNLLLNGYINENYNDYISLFHEVNMTKEDFSFERKIKSGMGTTFDYPLTNTENLIKRLSDKYFKNENSLNYQILDFLVENKLKYQTKFDNYFTLLQTDNAKVFEFIIGYIDTMRNALGSFIKILMNRKSTFWQQLCNKSGLPDAKISEMVKLIFEFGEYDDISRFVDLTTLIHYIENMQNSIDFFSQLNDTKSIKKFINEQAVLIRRLDIPTKNNDDFFEFIYKNNAYDISSYNIDVILTVYKSQQNFEQLHPAYYSNLRRLDLPDLLLRLYENIEEYIEKVMFQTPENTAEEENTVIDFLNNTNISKEIKSRIVNYQNISISNLSTIEQPYIKEVIIKSNKVKASWENIFDYFDSHEPKSLNSTLVSFLNIEEHYLVLSQYKLDSVKGKDSSFIKDFSGKLIFCDDLNLEAYTNLLKCIPYVYNSLDHKRLTLQKIEWMLSNKFLTLTVENFNGLKKSFPNRHIELLEVYQEIFIDKFQEFALDADDWSLLFKSVSFTPKRKIDIFKKMDDNIIIQNGQLAAAVCTILPDNTFISLRYELLNAIIGSDNSLKKKIAILNLHFDSLDDVQIQSLSEKLGEDYSKMFVKQHKPVFPDDQVHQTFFNNLQAKGLILRYERLEKKQGIRVLAKY